MKHLGDITKINGAEAPVVNVIIGGSPLKKRLKSGRKQKAPISKEIGKVYTERKKENCEQ